MSKAYLTAQEVADAVGISKSMAYVIIRKLNAELKQKGYIVIAGRISKKFFCEKYYGFEEKRA